MATSMVKSLTSALRSRSSSVTSGLKNGSCVQSVLFYSTKKAKKEETIAAADEEEDDLLTSGISRPISQILKELNKKVPDSLIRARTEPNGFSVKYIPWHIVNRIMNLHAPEWSGEVRNIVYSADGKSVTVTYRVTLYGTDAEIFRESTGTSSVEEVGYGDPVQKAEAMAFRRACARFGLGLHLYHEEL
ncbi:DNA repair RAD52-like protein 1, mitochondrial [Tanacetum coccineum]|uniref:DNA repair RAD52-like protein 1, mitochondrial n=1 Tax=Tanacetum coccineum TaxID=301880 RepID=A0ABQ5IP61_9ASTR